MSASISPRSAEAPMGLAEAVSGRAAALAILVVAAATIGGAYLFQYGWGYVPCKLCLEQRIPYYVAMPLALLTALAPPGLRRLGLALLAVVFLASFGLGIYHAGVEWHWWLGPSDCGGGAAPSAANAADFMKALNGVKIVSCTEAAWRFSGLSLAGWNAVISAALATLAGWAASRRPS